MLTRRAWQALSKGEDVIPWAIGKNGVLYGAKGMTILRSIIQKQENWEWSAVGAIPDSGQVTAIYELPSSQSKLIVSLRNGKNFLLDTVTGLSDMVHQFPSGYAYDWSFTEKPDGTVFIGEYGNKGQANNPRRVYKTTEGTNWDLVCEIDNAHGRHVHKVLYDPYDDALWVSQGDGDSKLWRATGPNYDDLVFQSVRQPTAGLVFEDCILWGEDGFVPNGISRWDRATNQYETVLNLSRDYPDYNDYIFDMGVMSDGTVLALSAAYNSGRGTIWAGKSPEYREWELVWVGQSNYMWRILVGISDTVWFTSQHHQWRAYQLAYKPEATRAERQQQ